MSAQEWVGKDFYKVLGVSKDADTQTIKKAYRKLARQYHPDQNKGDSHAEQRFKEIGEAYQVLSDPQQRQQYDAIRTMTGGGARFSQGPGGAGSTGFEDIFASMFGAGRGGAGGGASSGSYRSFGSGGSGFDDLLSGLFGAQGGNARASQGGFSSPFGGFGSGFNAGATQGNAPKGRDLKASATIDFVQALQGVTLKLTVENRPLTVRIPAGVRDGQKLRLKGKGRPSQYGGEPGNLVVDIHVREHPFLSIDNDKLYMLLPISVEEAVCGAKVRVPLLNGKSVNVKIPAGTSSHTVLRIKGHGVKDKKGKEGDLYIRVSISVNPNPTREEKQCAQSFTQTQGDFSVRQELEKAMS